MKVDQVDMLAFLRGRERTPQREMDAPHARFELHERLVALAPFPAHVAALAAELDAALPVLERIDRFYDRFHGQPQAAVQSVENAIIVSDVMVSFYTCLESAFLRISQFFENALDDSRWHEHLLRAMTRTVPGVRERVISDATWRALSELRRFRHFKRNYFSFDYDWDRLELVRSKYLACRGPVRGELAAYSAYLQRLAREAR